METRSGSVRTMTPESRRSVPSTKWIDPTTEEPSVGGGELGSRWTCSPPSEQLTTFTVPSHVVNLGERSAGNWIRAVSRRPSISHPMKCDHLFAIVSAEWGSQGSQRGLALPSFLRQYHNPTEDGYIHDPGAIAQLGERRLCKAEVIGSNPIGST